MSRSRDKAETAARRFGGRPYDDLERMLDTERPDAVWVCVTPDAHGALELGLIERGIHLMVEKPLAADPETPERINEALERTGIIAGVAYHWRAMDTLAEVDDVIANRPVKLLNGHWHDNMPGVAWWRDLATGGGQIVEQATHLVDLSRRLLGEGTVVAATADRHANATYPEMDVPGRRRRRSCATTPGRSARSRRPASSAGRAPRRSACSATTSRSRSASRASCTRTRGRRP